MIINIEQYNITDWRIKYTSYFNKYFIISDIRKKEITTYVYLRSDCTVANICEDHGFYKEKVDCFAMINKYMMSKLEDFINEKEMEI